MEGMARDRPPHSVQRRSTQRLADLPQPVIMARGARQARLEEGEHPTFLQTCPHLREGMLASQHRQAQRLDPTATGEDMGGVRSQVQGPQADTSCAHVEVGYCDSLVNHGETSGEFRQRRRELAPCWLASWPISSSCAHKAAPLSGVVR
jgi:hypothetical protein